MRKAGAGEEREGAGASRVRRCLAMVMRVLSLWLLLTVIARAQFDPFNLQSTLPSPSPVRATGEKQGHVIAMANGRVAVGSPKADIYFAESGAVRVYEAATGTLLHTLRSPSTNSFDNFGYAVAMSGDLLVVSAPNAYGYEGWVFVYDLAGQTPTEPRWILKNPNGFFAPFFGQGVAISGMTVAVGSAEEDVPSNHAGAVFLYDLDQPDPTTPKLRLNNPDPEPYLNLSQVGFGEIIAMDGSRVVVGLPTDRSRAGRAFVFDRASPTPQIPIQELSSPDASNNFYFGRSVAISGSTVVIGEPRHGSDFNYWGRAYVFELSGPTPGLPSHVLTNLDGKTFTNFGDGVAIQGRRVYVSVPTYDRSVPNDPGRVFGYDLDSATPETPVLSITERLVESDGRSTHSLCASDRWLAVGNPLDDTAAQDAGAVYVFDVMAANPAVRAATLAEASPSTFDNFGVAVAASGTRVAVGSDPVDDHPTVYVFDYASTPAQVLALVDPNPQYGDHFGTALAMSGSRLVVGARSSYPGDDSSGRVYVYDLAGPTPTMPIRTLQGTSGSFLGYFGKAVAISGDRIVVGSGLTGSSSTPERVYVFDLNRPNPETPLAIIPSPDPTNQNDFGGAVGVVGDLVVVGASNTDSATRIYAGAIYGYDLSSGSPTVPAWTVANPGQGDGYFGRSLSCDGTLLAVGAPENSNSYSKEGEVFVFDLSGGTAPTLRLTLRHPNPDASVNFGSAVSLSGGLLAVGAPRDYPTANNPADVLLFDLHGASPTVPIDIEADPDTFYLRDHFGEAVALEGNRLAVGAPYNNSSAQQRGIAYVYAADPLQAPVAGTLTITPNPLVSGRRATASFSGWLDLDTPLTYQLLIDNVATAPATTSTNVNFTAPEVGTHRFTGRIIDTRGNATEVVLDRSVVQGPDAMTQSAAAITFQGATLRGLVTANGLATTARFTYGTDANLANASTVNVSGTVDAAGVAVQASVSGLKASTTYYYRVLAQNAAAETAGEILNFITAGPPQTVVTLPASDLSFSAATLRGTVNPNGIATKGRFEYGTDSGLATFSTTADTSIGSNLGDTPLTADLKNLNPGTTYYFRAVGESDAGVVKGIIRSFVTKTIAPPRVIIIIGDGRGGIGAPPGNTVIAVKSSQGGVNLGVLEQTDGKRSDAIFTDAGEVLLRTGQPVPLEAPASGARERDVATGLLKKLGAPCGDAVLTSIARQSGRVTASNDQVLFAGLTAGNPQPVARKGQSIPNASGVTLKTFQTIDGNGGTTFFTGKLAGTGVNRSNDFGLFAVKPGTPLRLVARKGDPVGAKKVRTLATLVGFAGSLAEGRWRAGADDFGISVTFDDGSQALYIVPADASSPADWLRVAGSGDLAGPALPGARIATFLQPAFGPGALFTHANLRTDAGSISRLTSQTLFRASGIAVGGPVSLQLTAQRNRTQLGDGALTRVTSTLAGADLAATVVGNFIFPDSSKAQAAIYDVGTTGSFRQIARIGQTAPGGGKWSRFLSVAKSDGLRRGLIFTATLTVNATDGVTTANRTRLYAIGSDGELRKVLSVDDELEAAGPGSAKGKVKSFKALETAAGSIGAAHGYDNDGGVTALVTFTDRTQAVMKIDVP